MKYTNSELRAAVLRAADTFDRNPNLFQTLAYLVPGSGEQGCAIGYIMRYVGVNPGTNCLDGWGPLGNWHQFNTAMNEFDHAWNIPGHVAPALRAYADKYFPESSALVRYQDPNQIVDWASCAWRPEGLREMQL